MTFSWKGALITLIRHDADTLDRILTDHPEVDVVQLQINYLDWDGAVAQSRRFTRQHNVF